ncbi:MAG: right-handed parallel beta-helix repeat-containing protein [Myxococcales bacterium]|nr:right-handed parallel beta-helix repeat-containing protein [Myxococcales bacterium]
MNRRTLGLLLTAALCLTACDDKGSDAAEACSSEAGALANALASASSGETVTLCGQVEGSFVVPAGVRLVGQGSDGAQIVSVGGSGVLLEAGESSTELSNIRVVSDERGGGVAAVLAQGTGHVHLSSVTLQVEAGIGVIADGDIHLEVEDLVVEGSLDAERARTLSSSELSAERIAVAGLIAVCPSANCEANLSRVSVSGIAGLGIGVYGVHGEWSEVEVSSSAGTGCLVERSEVSTGGLRVHDFLEVNLLGRLSNQYGLVLSGGSTFGANTIEVSGIRGIGVLQDSAVTEIQRSEISRNDGPGVWIQNSQDTTRAGLRISDSNLVGNAGAGIQIVDSASTVVERTIVAETFLLPSVAGQDGALIRADGIQLTVNPASNEIGTLSVVDSVMFANGRTSVLADGLVTTDLSGVSICGQRPVLPEWNCQTSAGEPTVCLRIEGPRIEEPGWQCTDSAAGTECVVDPLADPDEPTLAVPESSFPSDCAEAVEGLMAGASLGSRNSASASWECEESGNQRVCRLEHNDNASVNAIDNPSGVNQPGWTCTNTEEGRRCSFGGLGAYAQNGAAAPAGDFDITTELADRDAAAEDASLSLFTESALEVYPTLGIVGENGLGLVRPDGIVNNQGVITDSDTFFDNLE